MRFMLLKHYAPVESGAPTITEWAPEDVNAHIEFQRALLDELTKTGELVEGQALAGPDQVKVVTFQGKGAPVVTDGPYSESKELLAGYITIDVDSLERAIEIAAKESAAPGPNGVPLGEHVELREVLGAPDPEV
jgi:hypothetical protein